MRHKQILFLFASLFAFVGIATGQVPDFPPVESLTPENIFQATIEPLYGLSVLLFGYLSAFIPGLKSWKPFYRVIAFALASGLGLVLFGGESIWKVALTYFLTSGLYGTFFKNIFASPKAA
jgi:hypothetical protein